MRAWCLSRSEAGCAPPPSCWLACPSRSCTPAVRARQHASAWRAVCSCVFCVCVSVPWHVPCSQQARLQGCLAGAACLGEWCHSLCNISLVPSYPFVCARVHALAMLHNLLFVPVCGTVAQVIIIMACTVFRRGCALCVFSVLCVFGMLSVFSVLCVLSVRAAKQLHLCAC